MQCLCLTISVCKIIGAYQCLRSKLTQQVYDCCTGSDSITQQIITYLLNCGIYLKKLPRVLRPFFIVVAYYSYFVLLFETRSDYVAPTDLELAI